jgi:hypothetical protein
MVRAYFARNCGGCLCPLFEQDFVQVLAMFSGFDFDWPPAVKTLYNFFSLLNFNFDLLAPECSLSINFETKWSVSCTRSEGTRTRPRKDLPSAQITPLSRLRAQAGNPYTPLDTHTRNQSPSTYTRWSFALLRFRRTFKGRGFDDGFCASIALAG